MTDISTLQSNVAASQANLQQTNTDLAHAQANLSAQTAAGHNTVAAQADVNDATQNQQIAQSQLNSNQAALDAATAGTTVSNPPSVAPENAQAPLTVDTTNGQTITNFATPTSTQLTQEATSKIATTGLTSSVSNVTSGVKIVTANGQATAVNVATGQTFATMGSVAPSGNTLPPNTLPVSASDNTLALKASLSQEPVLSGDPAGNSVVFDVQPAISETRDANYKSFTPIQHPGEILKYEGSTSRTWGITTKLVSFNVADADRNLRYMNLIRSWTMPFYGTGTATPDTQTSQYLGAPPPVLTFKAYGDKRIGPVKCVLLQYNWTWPNDVDYVKTSDGNPFPVTIDISINVKEAYSPAEYSSFNLLQYRSGNLPAAFGGAAATQRSALGSSTPASATTGVPGVQSNPNAVTTSSSNTATVSQVTSANASANASSQSANTGALATQTANQLAGGQQIQNVFGNS